LPFADQDFNQKSSAEQKLFAKMLTVLELPARQLMPGLLITNEDSPINQLQLTEKILFFNPKLILGFGECNYLDIALLESNNIIVMNTIHPRNLLQDPKLKKLAYQDLLLCKQKLASIS
jgi:uracil-DNA glycosylase